MVLVGLVLGWLSLALGLLLYGLAHRWWRRRRYGSPIVHGTLLIQYGQKMTAALDQGALAHILTVDLPNVLGTKRAALLLPQGHRLIAVQAPGLELPVHHAGVRWTASAGSAQRADGGRLHAIIQQGGDNLKWTQVWIPLMRGANLRGLWLLARREKGLQYGAADLEWLTALGRQAAIMLEAIHYAEQERLAASEMRALYRQVITAREREREHIARELHDGVLQDLCAVTRDLRALGAKDRDASLFTPLADSSGQMVHALRAICHDLRPPLLEHDLIAALKALVADLDARSPTPVYIHVSAEDLHLPGAKALAIFRITQEALNNAIRHADASEVAVRLTHYPDRLRLTITDDGRGITGGLEAGNFMAQGHYGLAGMRERAAMVGAKLEMQTATDYGTVVIFELPYPSRSGNDG